MPGERLLRQSVKHPAKIHVWGCMSASGFGELFLFQHNLDAKLCKIYERPLRRFVRKLFHGLQTLQEDNDSKYTSKLAKEWREENGVDRLGQPAQSPDQNCIEHVWRILKIKVAAKHPQTVQELAKAIRQLWSELPASLATNLVDRMPRRLAALIKAEGDYTMY